MKKKQKSSNTLTPNSGNFGKTALIIGAVVLLAIVVLFIGSEGSVTGEAKAAKTQCSDKIDNDRDGYCDYLTSRTRCTDGSIPGDADCASSSDNNEAPDCVPVPERCDGYDNNCNSQIDEGLPIACTSSSACGTTGWTGSAYCGVDGNVHKDYITYQCNYPGTCSSSCASQTTDQVYQYCSNGCSNGACLPNATFDFSVTASPSSSIVAAGQSAATTVTVSLLGGTSESVYLYTSNCPTSAQCSFGQTAGFPTFSTMFTVATSSNTTNSTPPGTYNIMVNGWTSAKQRSTTYTLTVS